jgi:hypothetical protein
MQNQYDDQTLYSLEISADLLHRFKVEPVIEEDKLPGLVDLVRTIIDEVSNDTSNVRAFLLHHLFAVEKALVHFRVVGYSGVEEAMDRFLGATLRTGEFHEPKTRNWFSRVWRAISGATTGAKQLSEGASSVMKAIETGKDLFGGA